MAEKLTLTLRDVQRLRRALNSLDAIKSDVDGREGLIVDRLDRELAQKIGVFEGMEKTDANGRLMDSYRREFEAMLDQTAEIELQTVKLPELLARPGDPKKQNPIPQSVLYGLMPIIQEEGT